MRCTGTLAEGNIVRLGKRGYLRMWLHGKGQPTSEGVTAAAIAGSKIVFTWPSL